MQPTKTPAQTFAIITLLKNEGNEFYKQKNYVEALRKYHEVLLTYVPRQRLDLGNLFGASNSKQSNSPEDDAAALQCEQVFYSAKLNMAACYSELKKHERVVQVTSEIISAYEKKDEVKQLQITEEQACKAYFRRAKSYLELKDYDKSFQDVQAAKALIASDPGVIAVEKQLIEIDKAYAKMDALVWKNVLKKK